MPSELAAALLKVHAALKPIPKKTDGPRGKYADLATVQEAVLPLLADAGLAWTCQPTLREDGQFVLRYKLIHAASGECEAGDWPLHGSANSQQMGSEVTYARRYCFGAVTGAVAKGEDDDGAAASQGRPQSRPRKAQQPTAPVTRTRTTGADHERLRHGTVVRTPDDRPADRGPLPDNQNQWQDIPPEELPGSVAMLDVQKIQMAYGKLGFARTDRAQLLNISKQIIGRELTGPNPGTTHNNMSLIEGHKLRDTLEAFGGDRGALMERLAGVTQAVAAVAAQDAAEGSQEAPVPP